MGPYEAFFSITSTLLYKHIYDESPNLNDDPPIL